jgi:hypothetical protein
MHVIFVTILFQQKTIVLNRGEWGNMFIKLSHKRHDGFWLESKHTPLAVKQTSRQAWNSKQYIFCKAGAQILSMTLKHLVSPWGTQF